jgi:hypothetical protein
MKAHVRLFDPEPSLYETRILDIARCPLCRAPLVARMGKQGPYFHCLCANHGRHTCSTAKTGQSAAGLITRIGQRRPVWTAQTHKPKGIHRKTRV